jgi:uncharacterized protein (TIGR00375 family)
MEVISDLHIHGRFSQATSKSLDIPNLVKYGRIKGLNLLGTGDFTHPRWIEELKSGLEEDGSGILKTRDGFSFLLQTEISLIYTQDGRGRKIHNIVLAPDFEVVEGITETLLKRGRVDYDGRPIFGIPSPEFVEIMKDVDSRVEIIPAHAWTPWFSIFGSRSGFDSVEECFQDQAKHIFALETGLSSDPAMNWRLSALDKYTLISNSDAHSFWPWRIGREANVFEMQSLNYDNLISVLKEKDPKKFLHTIEFFPEEGKYHLDGHRNCGIRLSPAESKKHNNLCPVCKKPLTIGVLNRVEELADRESGFVPKNAIPFKSLIPLSEIIQAIIKSSQTSSKQVWSEFNKLIESFRDELNILLNVPREDLVKVTDPRIADAIIKVREGKIRMEPGFDGEYGHPVFSEGQTRPKPPQATDFSAQKSLADF